MFDIDQRNNQFFMILEYCPLGNLQSLIQNKPSLMDFHFIQKMFQRICKGVRYLHHWKIVHLDLKSSNIFLSRNYIPKIGDFGWSCLQGEKSLRPLFEGEQHHLPPQAFEGEEIIADCKFDIWSLGVLLYELFHNKTPFYSDSVVKLEKNIKSGKFSLKEDLDTKAKDLINLMLDPDEDKRPNINAILHHSFFHETKTLWQKREGKGFIDHFKDTIQMN